jgi:predicted nucleic acid-binding protein
MSVVMLVAVRGGADALRDGADAELAVDAAEVVDLGLRYHLQGYDVVYFELARRLGAPVATLDGGMRTACGIFRVKLV